VRLPHSKQDALSPDGDRNASKDAEKPGMATARVIAITSAESSHEGGFPVMKSVVLSIVLILALAPALIAQVPYIETFEVHLHNLDVVVTDAKGNPVRGLTKNDFVVLENGVPQPVTNFSLYDTSASTASSVNAAPAEAETFEAVPPPPRHFVFFIDEIEVQRSTRQKLYRRVQEFVEAMRPGDVASVVRPTTPEKVVQEFTGDRAAIERALKTAIDQSDLKLTGLSGDIARLRTAMNPGSSLPSGAHLKSRIAIAQREYAFASRRRVEHRLGQLRALTSSLGSIEGRKILVMVTMGLGAEPGSEGRGLEQELNLPVERGFDESDEASDSERLGVPDRITRNSLPTIDDIARAAAANGVTIYALEPDAHIELMNRGTAAVPVRAGPRSGGGHFGPDTSKDLQSAIHIDLLNNSAATLNSLSEKTGGRWFRGTSGIDETFKQLSTDLSVYYSMAYRATGEANQPRRVQVQVRNRPELKVRTRTEVLQKSTGREMADLVVASLIYPRPVNELAVNVTAGAPMKARGYYTIPLDIVLPMNKLTFLRSEDGAKYVASFNVHFASAGRERDFISGGKAAQIVEITPEQHANLAGVNYRYKTGITVSEGASKIAIGLIDETTKLTGFGTVEVLAK
jgi:VWFA-related protein